MRTYKKCIAFMFVVLTFLNANIACGKSNIDVLFEEDYDYQDYKTNGYWTVTDTFVNKNQTPVWSTRQGSPSTMIADTEGSDRTGYGDVLKIATTDVNGSLFYGNNGSGNFLPERKSGIVVTEHDFRLNKSSLPSYDSYIMCQLMTTVNSEFVIPFVIRRSGEEIHILRHISSEAVLHREAFTDGEWVRLRIIFDYNAGKWYAEFINQNGKKTCFVKESSIPDFFKNKSVRSVRITYNVSGNTKGSEAAVYIDNFRHYAIEGITGYADATSEADKYSDMTNFSSMFNDKLNKLVVLNVSCSKALVKGVKKTVVPENIGVCPVEENSIVYIPLKGFFNINGISATESQGKVVAEISGEKYEFMSGSDKYYINSSEKSLKNKIVLRDGVVMLSAEDIATAFNYKLTLHNGGLIIFSEDNHNLYELEFDAVKNRLIYHDPDEEKFKRDFKNVHPRVLVPSQDVFKKLRENINTDTALSLKYNELIKTADATIKGKHYNCDIVPLSQIHILRKFRQRAELLGMAYGVTKNDKYAAYLYEETKLAAAVTTDWRSVGYLNAGTLLMGLAVAYDRLYYYLDENERKELRNEIITRHIMPGLEAHRGTLLPPSTNWSDKMSTVGWVRWNSNWNIICNSGLMAMACAMFEDEAELSCEILTSCYKSLKYYTPSFYPDGAALESLGYLNVIASDFARLLATLDVTFENTYGIDDAPGIAKMPYVLEYLTGPHGTNNFGDAAEEKTGQPAEALIFADLMHNPSFAALRNRAIGNGYCAAEVTDVLWHSDSDEVELSLDKYFRVGETGSMRSTWDEEALFVSFHAGDNNINHSHMDTGTFVLDALGERWAIELGSDRLSYSMDKESGISNRWDLYMLRTEGHNTITINPDETPGQRLDAFSPVESFESITGGSTAIVDMTGAYDSYANKAKRGYMLQNDRSVVTVRDEIELKENGDIYWFMHTKADITISDNGRMATLLQNGKKLYVKLNSNRNVNFEVMEATPFETSPKLNYQASTEGIRKLAVVAKGTKKLEMSVSFSADAEKLNEAYDGKLSDWSAGNIFRMDYDEYENGTAMKSTKGGFISPCGKLYTYSNGSFTAKVQKDVGKNVKRDALQIYEEPTDSPGGFWMWENETNSGKKDKIIVLEQSYYVPADSDFATDADSWLCHDNRFGENMEALWYAYALRNGNITNRTGDVVYAKMPLDEWFTVRVVYFVNEGGYSIILEKEDGSRCILLPYKLITNTIMLDAMKGFGYNKSRTQMFMSKGKTNIYIGNFSVRSIASYADTMFDKEYMNVSVMMSDREEMYNGKYTVFSALYDGEKLVGVEHISELEADEALSVRTFVVPYADVAAENKNVGVFIWDKNGFVPIIPANFTHKR